MFRQEYHLPVAHFVAAYIHSQRPCRWLVAVDLFAQMAMFFFLPDIVSYNSMLSSCDKNSEWQRACHVFSTSTGIKADVISYTTAVSSYIRALQWHLGLALFQEMTRVVLEADVVSYWLVLVMYVMCCFFPFSFISKNRIPNSIPEFG